MLPLAVHILVGGRNMYGSAGAYPVSPQVRCAEYVPAWASHILGLVEEVVAGVPGVELG